MLYSVKVCCAVVILLLGSYISLLAVVHRMSKKMSLNRMDTLYLLVGGFLALATTFVCGTFIYLQLTVKFDRDKDLPIEDPPSDRISRRESSSEPGNSGDQDIDIEDLPSHRLSRREASLEPGNNSGNPLASTDRHPTIRSTPERESSGYVHIYIEREESPVPSFNPRYPGYGIVCPINGVTYVPAQPSTNSPNTIQSHTNPSAPDLPPSYENIASDPPLYDSVIKQMDDATYEKMISELRSSCILEND